MRIGILALALSCSGRKVDTSGDEALFRQAHVEGAFVLRDLASGEETIVGQALAAQSFLPCSTFKIPNTLVGLETGVIPDEHFSLPWDGVDRGRAVWNRDQDLASAMRNSVVWFYQEVARRIGEARMREWVRRLGYGNHDTSPRIDTFWLNGGLRISARQQVDFLERLRERRLPVTREHAALVERLIVQGRGDGWTWRGKTGLGEEGEHAIGWLVGLADRGGRSFAYALVVRAPRAEMDRIAPRRRPLAGRLLVRHGALPRTALR